MKFLNSQKFLSHFKVRIQISKVRSYTITQKQKIWGIIYQKKIKYKSISTSAGRIHEALTIIPELLKQGINYKNTEKVEVNMGEDWS